MMKSNDLIGRRHLGGAYDVIRPNTLEHIRIECRIVGTERVRSVGSDFRRHAVSATESKLFLFYQIDLHSGNLESCGIVFIGNWTNLFVVECTMAGDNLADHSLPAST